MTSPCVVHVRKGSTARDMSAKWRVWKEEVGNMGRAKTL